MTETTISMREIQRNYKEIFEKAKREKKPLFLGAHGKPEAVVLDIDVFRNLQKKIGREVKKRHWGDIYRALERLSGLGRQNISLSDFIHNDRKAH